MADKLPYFRWFPKDAETSEAYASMTDAELGFYHRCLNRAWLNDGLPADPAKRAQSLQKPRAYADKMWAGIVGERFKLDENGRYRNDRQEEERKKAIRKSEQASDAVSERERKRIIRSSSDESNDDLRAQARAGSGSVSGSSEEVKPEEQEKPPENEKLLRSKATARFEQFWAVYWRKVGKSTACKIYNRKEFTEELHQTILLSIEAQTPYYQHLESEGKASMIPHPSTWLNRAGWLDQIQQIPQLNGRRSKSDEVMEVLEQRALARGETWD